MSQKCVDKMATEVSATVFSKSADNDPKLSQASVWASEFTEPLNRQRSSRLCAVVEVWKGARSKKERDLHSSLDNNNNLDK
ncbi:uncharacterized [Tachysurus ichikawai]